jgi:hypothetical protein
MNKDFFVPCSVLCAVAGALLYAVLTFEIILPANYDYFGTDIYNAYYYRLTEGRFDLPARMLRYEGHYASDATGFLYHFFAPLLTRALLAPFVALNEFPTAKFSIWIWATTGTILYHITIARALRAFANPILGYSSVLWSIIVGFGIWFSGPGLLLVANTAIYHEPIAIAYAAMALAVFLMMRCEIANLPLHRVIVPLAFLAGILLQSRPHMGIGLYVGVCIIGGLTLWSGRRKPWIPVGLAGLILTAFLATTMQLNAIRFGSVTQAHGQFDQESIDGAVQYGSVFWGKEEPDSTRAQAFTEHGTFHPWRILPNLMVYVLDLPSRDLSQLRNLHFILTKPISGYGRIEPPGVGILFLWTVWTGVAFIGVYSATTPLSVLRKLASPLAVSTGIAMLILLCYPTITLRYRIDLWPFLVTLGLLGLPDLINRIGADWLKTPYVQRRSLALLSCGIVFSTMTIGDYTNSFQTTPNSFFRTWDVETCTQIVNEKGFAETEVARICVAPETAFMHN